MACKSSTGRCSPAIEATARSPLQTPMGMVGDTSGPGYIKNQKRVRKVECKQPSSAHGLIWNTVYNRMNSWGFESSTFSTSLWIRGGLDATLKFEQPDCCPLTSGQNWILWGCFGTQSDKSYPEIQFNILSSMMSKGDYLRRGEWDTSCS